MPISSAKTYVVYGWESTFGTAATTLDKTFGKGTRVTTLSLGNAHEKVGDLGDRNIVEFIEGAKDVRASVDFVISNPWWLQGILGSVATTGAGPYDHTFSETDTIPSLTLYTQLNVSTPFYIEMLGGKMSTLSLSASVGSLVRGTIDILFADWNPTAGSKSQVVETFNGFAFHKGTVKKDTVVIGEVQSFDLKVDNGLSTVNQLGSRVGQDHVEGQRTYEITMQVNLQDTDDLDDLDNLTEVTVDFELVNTSDNIKFTVSNCKFDVSSLGGLEAVNPVTNSLTLFGKTTSVVAQNTVATAL